MMKVKTCNWLAGVNEPAEEEEQLRQEVRHLMRKGGQEGTQTEHGTVPGHQVLGHRAQGHSEAGHHAGELHHRQEFAVYQSTKNLQLSEN